MRLLIDGGNTRLKWRRVGVAPAAGVLGWPELERGLPSLLDGVEAVWCCLPGHEARRSLLCDLLARHGLEAHQPDRALLQARLRPVYSRPERMGLDRLLALRAACEQRPGEPLIVIDAGTAITLDALDAQGRHAGGVILPGLGPMGEALAERTGLPALAPAAWQSAARSEDTEAALGAGLCGLVGGGLQRLVGDLEAALGADRAALLVTGGDAELVQSLLGSPSTLCQNLVLDGLALESEC